ncbi:MAG: deoxyribonuclease IV, partial [Coprococcus sp.]
LSYGADTLMVYTGAPQNTRRKEIENLRIEEGWELMRQHGMNEIVIHAPYIINLGNTVKPETYELAVEFLEKEIARTAAMGSRVMILHPGAHVGAGAEAGIRRIVEGLNAVLTADTPVNIALETMAGKGSEIGRSFEELAAIYEGVHYNDKLRVCFDTCHVHDAGYDIINDFSGVMTEFDKLIGQDQIAVFHVNDSKNVRGAGKDRHENFGFGEIGFDALMNVVKCPDFEDVPKILESPYVPSAEDKKISFAPYKYEIEMIRSGVFDPDLKQKILQATL